jgi:ABC-type lipoprotein release transport system permease subunit
MGIAIAIPVLRLLESSLAGLESRHTSSLFGAVAVVLATAGLACWFPARHATLIDPVAALRLE